MVAKNDILLDDDFDVIIKDGDFLIGEASQQHQQLLLISEKGMWKQYPVVGVAMQSFLLDDDYIDDFKKEVKKQFEMDGMEIDAITQSEITAHYIK